MPCNCRKTARPYTPGTQTPKTQYIVRDQTGTHSFDTLQEAQAYKAENPTAGVIVKQN